MNGHQSFDEKQPPQHMNHHLLHAHEYQPFRLKRFQPEPTTPHSFAEAVVQRVPEYVDPVDRPSVNAYDITLAPRADRALTLGGFQCEAFQAGHDRLIASRQTAAMARV